MVYLVSTCLRKNCKSPRKWEKYNTINPNLYEKARVYLGILDTSGPCERLFSKAGLIITHQRNRVSSNVIKVDTILLFLVQFKTKSAMVIQKTI